MPQLPAKKLTRRPSAIYISAEDVDQGKVFMAVHLTPTELADEMHMKRREVLAKCIEMNVPVLKGRIDRTLFESSLKAFQAQDKRATA
jgi:hypothetical protein